MTTESKCPRCGEEMDRDSADVGVGIIYGPWGCPVCHFSEDERAGQVIDGRYHDIFGGSYSVERIVEGCERFGLGDAARSVFESLAPNPVAEGGAGCPAVVQTEPGPVVGGADTAPPARASIDESEVLT